MGNCFNSTKKQQQTVEIQKNQVTQEPNTSSLNLKMQNQVPKLYKKRVKETVKLIKSVDEKGHKMINNYILMEVLGQGEFGVVRLCIKKQDLDEEKYAVKIFKKSMLKRKREYFVNEQGERKFKDALQDVQREIAIMKKLYHKNVIKLHEVINNPDKDKFYMIIDYAYPGQLIEWDSEENRFFFQNENQIEFFDENYLRQLFRGCIEGLNYLHNHGIIHQDIKPQNLLLGDNNQMKIADFGISQLFKDNDILIQQAGTYYFMAPETFDDMKNSQGFSGRSFDIWSLGVTFFCFIYLELPFFSTDQQELQNLIRFGELKFPNTRNDISLELKELLKKMIQKDPKKRITLQEIINDKWINKGYQEKEFLKNINEQQIDISDNEITNAVSLATVIRIKNWVQKWKNQQIDRQNSQNSLNNTFAINSQNNHNNSNSKNQPSSPQVREKKKSQFS